MFISTRPTFSGVMDPILSQAEKYISDSAAKGAEEAVKPYVYASLGASILALVIGLAALAKRR